MKGARQVALKEIQQGKDKVKLPPNENGEKNYQNIMNEYAIDVFSDKFLRESLPLSSYKEFMNTLTGNKQLDPSIADQVANAMREWAQRRGATHFTHWFQPLTGLTAEKHDSFLNFANGKLMLEFSGKELIKGEPDASSFPSGGIRSTFEARGYTAWDMKSPPFIRKGKNSVVLCVPTAFCSWTGEALDQKTPLLRSEEALSAQAVRLLNLMGDTNVSKVTVTLGVEQEFFLVDKAFYLARPDLVVCGRTVLGAKPPKGQEMEDHYFGSIPERILACIEEVEWQAWKLGVPMKTRHNEVAPSQFEMSPIFEEASLASDHNMLLMELLKSTAERHGLACLLHEKPFNGINGSGKHNNWSMQTDTGINLLDPGKTPEQNARFIVFLTAVIKAIDQYAHLLRCSIVTPGNDHRLGGNEAPPAIISIYLGEQLNDICQKLMGEQSNGHTNKSTTLRLRASTLPPLPRDQSDRNRTSPFAFTGNKFEFRAVGSSQSPARPMFILNSIVADSVRSMADELEGLLKQGKDQNSAIETLIQTTLKKHYRVVFNGNGYSKEWQEEAQARGLRILRNSPDALSAWNEKENIAMFESLGVLSAVEALSHSAVLAEQFVKATSIEASVALSMAKTQILPAAIKHQKNLATSLISTKQALGLSDDSDVLKDQKSILSNLSTKISQLVGQIEKLTNVYNEGEKIDDHHQQMFFYQKEVAKEMSNLREICDHLETVVDDSLWPLPKYSEILFLK